MMPISLQQIDVSAWARAKNQAVGRSRFKSTSSTEVKKAAVAATHLSINQSLNAHPFWAEIISSCRLAQLPITTLLFDQIIRDRSLAEHVIEAGYWRSCVIFAKTLEDGVYAYGAIIKDGNLLTTVPDDKGRSRGIKIYKDGGYYGGEFKNGLRDGLGVWDSARMWTYAGEWAEDKMEGQGCSDVYFPSHKKEAGLFVDGVLSEPSHNKNLWQSFRDLIK